MSENGHKKRTMQKRSEILSHALECFKKHGYGETTFNTIWQDVGGSKSSIYNNFNTKEDMLKALIEQQSVDFEKRLQEELKATDYSDIHNWLVSIGKRYRMLLNDTCMTTLMGYLPSSSVNANKTNAYFIFSITHHPASIICNQANEHFNLSIKPHHFSHFVKQISQAWMFRQWLGQTDSDDDIRIASEQLLLSDKKEKEEQIVLA